MPSGTGMSRATGASALLSHTHGLAVRHIPGMNPLSGLQDNSRHTLPGKIARAASILGIPAPHEPQGSLLV